MKPEVRERVERYCDLDHVYVRGPGCSHCVRGIGGQIVIAEVVRTDRRLMQAYKSEGQFAAYDYWEKQAGGLSKCRNLIARINEGIIDPTSGEEDGHGLSSQPYYAY
ncbi:hypothetical protein CDEF62S_00026 [Castellaniella defragrans]